MDILFDIFTSYIFVKARETSAKRSITAYIDMEVWWYSDAKIRFSKLEIGYKDFNIY